MKLRQVRLKNFRCYKEEATIDIDDLTVFIGKNDSGKSSILDALDIFFNEPKGKPDKDDHNVSANGEPVEITCIFEELPNDLIIDEAVSTTLQDEYMVNADGYLEVKKIYPYSGKSKIIAVANHPTNVSCNDLLLLTNAKLKTAATNNGVDLTAVDQRINTALRKAIWDTCDDLQLAPLEIELAKESAKAIWEKLKPQLPVYAIFKSDRASTDQDAEAQDPMKAAVKEAIAGQEDTLNEIAEKVKEQVQQIADMTVEKIMEMNPELASQLNPRVASKRWDSLFSVSLTGDEDIPINKRGSGTRRLILLNFFRAKAEQESQEKGTNVIYAVEEPETSQHPNNQKMLIDAFEDLAENADCQVLLTTHTPVLARRFNRSNLRLINGNNGDIEISTGSDDGSLNDIVHTLGVLPDHDVKVFVGVEGKNDINYLLNISRILSDAGETDIPNLTNAEQEGKLVFIPLGGSSIELWTSHLAGFNRPEFHIMDRDTIPPAAPHYQSIAEDMNSRDKCTAWTTSKKELENYIHKDVISDEFSNYAGQNQDFEDVPSLFAQVVHESSESETAWSDLSEEKIGKKTSRAKKRLNTDIVSKMTSEQLTEIDTNSDIRNWLREIGNALNSQTSD